MTDNSTFQLGPVDPHEDRETLIARIGSRADEDGDRHAHPFADTSPTEPRRHRTAPIVATAAAIAVPTAVIVARRLTQRPA